MKIYSLLALGLNLAIALNLVGCATAPHATNQVPGYGVTAQDSTGFHFTNDKKVVWVRRGVPAEWFQPQGDGWHISDVYFSEGAEILDQNKNK